VSTLPVYVRRLTLAVIALSGLVGLSSAQFAAQLTQLEKMRSLDPVAIPFDAWGSTEAAPRAAAARLDAEVQGLESMHTSRMLVLLALTTCATLTFVGGLRMLKPAGGAREEVRRMLASSLVACAVLRTIDGAQLAALARRIGAASDKVMLGSDVPGGYPDGLLADVLGAIAIGMTVLVAGGFLALSMFFRSDRLRAVVAAADRAEEET
jgi:hypothetical protein